MINLRPEDSSKIQAGIEKLSTFCAQIRIPVPAKAPSSPKRKINKKRLILFIGAVACFIAGLIYSVYLLFAAKPFDEKIVFELGTHITDDPAQFIDAGFIARRIINPDISGIDASRPGTYEVGINYFGKDLTTEIKIIDSIVPEIMYRNGNICFPTDSEIRPIDLISAVKDADLNVAVSFDGNLAGKESLNFAEAGFHSVWIVARDSSGNASRALIDFFTDAPPALYVHDDFYIAAGSDIELLSLLAAYDETDGDLTADVTMSPSEYDLSEEGEFEVSFSVRDSFDFTTSKQVRVHVMDPESIQQLIGKGEISRENASIIGAINIYDTGLISNQNFENTLIDVMPTVVHIEVPETTGTFKTGSGFIAEITGSFIWLLTNRHVVGNSDTCDVYFYDGSVGKAIVVGTDDDYDVAVIKIPLSEMPEGFENFISTVHIDMTYWNKLDNDDNISLGLEKMDTDGTIIHYTYGQLVKVNGNFEYFEPHGQTEMSLRLRPGDSGSAVFDARGRLICMAFGYSISPERDWGVPLDEIVRSYKEITGRTLYTY